MNKILKITSAVIVCFQALAGFLTAQENLDEKVTMQQDTLQIENYKPETFILQSPEVRERRIKQMLERLDRLLQRAEKEVETSENQKAANMLDLAGTQRDNAVNAVLRQEYRVALTHFRLAKYFAQRAIFLIDGKNKPVMERLREERTQYRELFVAAREAVDRSNNKLAQQAFNQAKRKIVMAQRAFRRGTFCVAINYYRESTRLLLRALSLAGSQSQSHEEQARRSIQRVDELLATTKRRVNTKGQEEALDQLREAKALQDQAKEKIAVGEFREAIERSEGAREIIARVAGKALKTPQDLESRVRLEMGRLQTSIEKNGIEISGQDSSEADALRVEVLKMAQIAEQAINHNQNNVALQLVLAANKLLLASEQMENKAPTTFSETNIQAQLQSLDNLINKTNTNLDFGDEEAEQLFNYAKSIRADAAKALSDGHLQMAQHLTRVSAELCRKAAGK